MADTSNVAIVRPPNDARVPTATAVTGTVSGYIDTGVYYNGGALPGMFRFQAIGADITVLFSATNSQTNTPTNGTNGETIPSGQFRDFFVGGNDRYFRAIGSAAGTLQWRRTEGP
jgi:hypothetical protein